MAPVRRQAQEAAIEIPILVVEACQALLGQTPYLAANCWPAVDHDLQTGIWLLELGVRAGRLATFQGFIAGVDARAGELPANLRGIHRDVYACVRQGDPTPFKAFRYNEYRITVERMGWLDDDAPVAVSLEREILITQEVREMMLTWRAQGALLFGLSDKPDEASVPTDELAAQGYQAIHRTQTHAIGG